mmetsp:Transcript_5862/g.15894  ORF Transcript_5862/g.15894 Transcript_5862/m.15894 type:complete len:299 (-) Transcript_5862:338-1234(-)
MSGSSSIADPRAISRDLFSAAIGSVCCCYVGQPMDTIKVRMQTQPEIYSGVWASTRQVIESEGIPALWKGAVPTSFGMIAENCMAFGVNEALKRAFPDEPQTAEQQRQGLPSLTKPFLMGAITGCFSAMVLLPSEVIKAKTQVAVGESITPQAVVKRILKARGPRGIFAGLDAQLSRDSTFYAIFFGGYEVLCYSFRTLIPSMPDELNYFLSGGFAGMFGWACAMPLDVPKTNVQSRYETKVVGSYFPELVKIARERGIRGLYSGLGPTLVRAFPANAALFLGVETGKKCFDNLVWKE